MASRTALKDYFKKGSIPKESDFADLIDSMVIQDEDSILKPPNDPLSIKATGADESLLNFYRVEQGGSKLSWQLKQKPDGKPGLSIHDSAASRLFIESGAGRLGIGTTTPQGSLHIARGSAEPQAVATDGALPYGGEKADLVLTRRHGPASLNGYPAALIDFRATNDTNQWSVAQILSVVDLNVGGGQGGGLAFLTTAPFGTDKPSTTNLADGRTIGRAPATRMVIDANGNVGIGALSPQGRLQIVGPPSFDSSTILRITNGATDHGRTNLVLTSRLNGGNDGWTFGSGARNSIVFSKNEKAANVDVGGLGVEQFSIQLEGTSNSLGFLTAARAAEPALVIQQNGNVGIGTATPKAALDVNGYIMGCNPYDRNFRDGEATGGVSDSARAKAILADKPDGTFIIAGPTPNYPFHIFFYWKAGGTYYRTWIPLDRNSTDKF